MLQVIATALLSGLFSGISIFALNERKEKTNYRLAKLEELAVLFSDWSNGVIFYYSRAYAFTKKRLPDNFDEDSRRLEIANDAMLSKLRALLNIYSNNSNLALSAVATATKPLVILWRDISFAHIDGDMDATLKLAKEIFAKTHDVLDAQTAGLNSLYSEARTISEQPTILDRFFLRNTKSMQLPSHGTPSSPHPSLPIHKP